VDRDKNDDWESDDVSGVNKPVHSNYIWVHINTPHHPL
jgi:hypothetical protein